MLSRRPQNTVCVDPGPVTEAALPDPTQAPSLAIKAVLRDTGKLYRDLFGRTVLTGFIVFGVLAALET